MSAYPREETVPESGMGTLCPEAQADGVPCPEQGKPCEQCERALGRQRPRRRSN